ncbi:Auxin response factor 19 [Spatholobus suberectus]|nr:Auxin response factor 19 [Spatholobus suberectus]
MLKQEVVSSGNNVGGGKAWILHGPYRELLYEPHADKPDVMSRSRHPCIYTFSGLIKGFSIRSQSFLLNHARLQHTEAMPTTFLGRGGGITSIDSSVRVEQRARISLGVRFRMMFKTKESGVRRYLGTITRISDLDPLPWKKFSGVIFSQVLNFDRLDGMNQQPVSARVEFQFGLLNQ